MRKFKINVNGNSYEVEVEEVGVEDSGAKEISKPASAPQAQKEKSAVKPAPKAKVTEVAEPSDGQEIVESPMPGNIFKLMVSEGDSVSEGDVLLILEAMKMENEIISPRSGKVVAINTSQGSTVSAGENLMVIE